MRRQCPGCGRYFNPGGYTNHLKLTQNPRCKSIRDSVFQPAFGTTSFPSGSTSSLEPLTTLTSPIPGPSRTPENLDSDVEMMDIDRGSQDSLLPGPNTNPPDQFARVHGHGADEWDNSDELLSTLPHHQLSAPVIIGLDTDSDSSDDDDDDDGGNETQQSRHQESTAPPGRSFRSQEIVGLC